MKYTNIMQAEYRAAKADLGGDLDFILNMALGQELKSRVSVLVGLTDQGVLGMIAISTYL